MKVRDEGVELPESVVERRALDGRKCDISRRSCRFAPVIQSPDICTVCDYSFDRKEIIRGQLSLSDKHISLYRERPDDQNKNVAAY